MRSLRSSASWRGRAADAAAARPTVAARQRGRCACARPRSLHRDPEGRERDPEAPTRRRRGRAARETAKADGAIAELSALTRLRTRAAALGDGDPRVATCGKDPKTGPLVVSRA